jgi:hypothetical protein
MPSTLGLTGADGAGSECAVCMALVGRRGQSMSDKWARQTRCQVMGSHAAPGQRSTVHVLGVRVRLTIVNRWWCGACQQAEAGLLTIWASAVEQLPAAASTRWQ